MKKLLLLLSIGAIVMFTAPTGCIKSTSSNNALGSIPDLSNFLVDASNAFKAGAAAYVKILSTSLGNGTFNVNFTLTGANTGSGTATLTMNGGSGTFSTPVITNAGPTTVTITSISNSSSSATPTSHNTSSMFDSTGLMNATYTPSGSSAQTLYATDVTASLAGTLLTIHGVIWTPNLTTITVYNDIYAGATGTTYFNSSDLTPGDLYSTFNGSAAYGVSGSSGVISDLSSHGWVTINTVTPLITGSFSYTNQDSSVVAGTFSCPHP